MSTITHKVGDLYLRDRETGAVFNFACETCHRGHRQSTCYKHVKHSANVFRMRKPVGRPPICAHADKTNCEHKWSSIPACANLTEHDFEMARRGLIPTVEFYRGSDMRRSPRSAGRASRRRVPQLSSSEDEGVSLGPGSGHTAAPVQQNQAPVQGAPMPQFSSSPPEPWLQMGQQGYQQAPQVPVAVDGGNLPASLVWPMHQAYQQTANLPWMGTSALAWDPQGWQQPYQQGQQFPFTPDLGFDFDPQQSQNEGFDQSLPSMANTLDTMPAVDPTVSQSGLDQQLDETLVFDDSFDSLFDFAAAASGNLMGSQEVNEAERIE